MTAQTGVTLKTYFNTDDVPTEAQFADLIDSFHNKTDDGTALVSSAIGTTVQAYDAATLKADTTDVLTAGFGAGLDDDGTQTTGTYAISYTDGNYKTIVNGGAFTMSPPTMPNNQAVDVLVFVVNNASAGAITTSGFSKVVGDSFTTTNGDKFACRVSVFDIAGTEYSLLQIIAMQ